MEDYEKLGVFYLGRQYDLEQKQPQEHLILYDSRDLVTHAVCVGMTGSGKTGLCISLIEEAAIDGVPAILIDPKGDLSNLLLTFPQLRGEDFLPWINLDDARQQNLSPQDFANQQAELWRSGLAKWGQSGERIQRLRDSADFRIYTPGSNAGFPVSILTSFASPGARLLEDNELLRERISTTVTSLLGLLGIEADPLQSREHILLSTILDSAWRQGQDLDLAGLIQQVQNPPLSKIGVLDLETFYPAKDRFGLVLMLNNLLASPGFNAWMEGQPLDIGQILYTPAGKPRIAIFSVAHLSDAERMFFVSLLLNQVLGWMRIQSGTTSLRAILYMDEIFGYLPPLSNPPSKLPMLTLLKQGRAFGLGVVLATQNPVDLDYKALSNTGTWFIGRLQTERDKARLLDGLEGAAATTGTQFDRQTIETILSGLGNRVFLMNNTHEDAPVLMQTRWALSYLRGPLSRDQIKTLMDPLKATPPEPAAPMPLQQPASPPPAAAVAASAPTQAISSPVTASPATAGPGTTGPTDVGQPPALPPDVSNFYIPARGSAPANAGLIYRAVILGAARVTFSDAKANVDTTQDLVYTTPVTDQVIAVDWANAQEAGVALGDLEKNGQPGAQYADLPAVAMQSRSYNAWSKDFTAWLYGNQRMEVLRSPSSGSVSNPGESERDFRIRLQQEARETRDASKEKLRQKYAPKFTALQERQRRAQQAVDREAAQAKQVELQTAISFGATLLSAFTGRKTASRSTLGRATTAARGVSRSMEQRQDIDRAKDTVEAIQKQMKELQDQFDAEVAALQFKIDPMTEELQTLAIKPKKTDISVQLLALVWTPYWLDAQGVTSQAW
jgi:hypothetical protein